jgi:cytochrome c-type biogenesis protein CcmF
MNTIGNVFLYASLMLSILQFFLPLWGIKKSNIYFIASARPLCFLQCFVILCAYAALTYAFLQDDFSLQYVTLNSHPALPFMYKLTAVWGAHEGSVLLWIVLLNAWAVVFALTQAASKQRSLVLSLLSAINFCFLIFLIFTSNPFLLAAHWQVPHDLNPLLQDPGFVIHPPILYIGYVGMALIFALTLAALLEHKLDQAWARTTKKYLLAAWCFLTLGITLGSWWAYRVLGWGGFWFWDPVENASLLPWLASTALLHVLILTAKRGIAERLAAFLAIVCFVLSVLGTFLVRSGILVSAHTFANDPERGIFLLILLGFLASVALFIFLRNQPKTATSRLNFLSRETALLSNATLLGAALLIILLGTLYPLLLDALHLGTISVGAPYFNLVLLPVVLLVLLTMLIASFIPWQQAQRLNVIAQLRQAPGMALAHLGFIILILGILLSSTLSLEREVRMKPGDGVKLGPYQFFFLGVQNVQGSNYKGVQAAFDVVKGVHHVTNLYPEKRIYTIREMVMTHVAIDPGLLRDLYLALGQPLEDNYWSVRLYYKPFMRWVWGGGVIMILGALVTLFKRKNYA